MNTNSDYKENPLTKSDTKLRKVIKKTIVKKKVISNFYWFYEYLEKKSTNSASTPIKEEANLNEITENQTSESTPRARDSTQSFGAPESSRKTSEYIEADVTNDDINVTYDGDDRLHYDKSFDNKELRNDNCK